MRSRNLFPAAVLLLALAAFAAVPARAGDAFIVETPFGPVETTLEATLQADEAGRPIVAVSGSLSQPGIAATFEMQASTVGPLLSDLRGTGRIDVTLTRLPLPGGGTVSGALPLSLTADETGWSLAPRAAARLTLSALPGGLGLKPPYTLTLPKSFRLTARPKGDGVALSTAVAARLTTRDGAEAAVSGRLSATFDPTAPLPATVAFKDVRLTFAGLTVDDGPMDGEISGVTGTLALGADGPAVAARIETVSLPSLKLAPPLRYAASARLTGETVRFRVAAEGKRHPLSAVIEGSHSRRDGRGAAEVTLAPTVFMPGGLQPHHLHPALIQHIQDADGEIALTGSVAWTGREPPTADMKFLMRDLSFSHGFVKVSRANAVVDIVGLAPLRTPPGQQLAVAAVDAGLPLTDGLVTFHIDDGSTLLIDRGALTLAGGRILLENERIPLDGTPFNLTPRAEAIDLERLAEQARIGGLTATGRLKGMLPLTLAGGDILIRGGVLEAEGPGSLSYAPAATLAETRTGGETASIAWTALKDLRYKALRLTIDGRTSGQIDVGLSLSGSNPELYDGYPVELNIDVSGPIVRALTQGLEGYRVPDRIREKMLGFPGRQ